MKHLQQYKNVYLTILSVNWKNISFELSDIVSNNELSLILEIICQSDVTL
jgi:hypothetical protein